MTGIEWFTALKADDFCLVCWVDFAVCVCVCVCVLVGKALVELVLIAHDDFMRENAARLGAHDPIERRCWHAEFPLNAAGFGLGQWVEMSRKNLARESRLAQAQRKKSAMSKELKGTFKPCKAAGSMAIAEFVPHLIHKAAARDESRIAYLKEIPARVATYEKEPLSSLLCEDVARALGAVGITRLCVLPPPPSLPP